MLKLLILTTLFASVYCALPVVLWHGMGDTCCYFFSMGAVKKEIEKSISGVYVKSIEIGTNIVEDEAAGFLGNVNEQVDNVCKQLGSDPQLRGGFNAIGFSQGSQFLRAYVQRCNNPPVNNLITFGGQHLGVSDFPHCLGTNQTLCKLMMELLSKGAYAPGVRDVSVQAQYFRSPIDYDSYLANNIFLPDINNEKAQKNATYKANLSKLNKLVLIKFSNDTMVVPRESSFFGGFQINSTSILVPMRQQPIYTEDWIGLKTLDQQGKLLFQECPGDHMQFTMEYLHDRVIVPYLQ